MSERKNDIFIILIFIFIKKWRWGKKYVVFVICKKWKYFKRVGVGGFGIMYIYIF